MTCRFDWADLVAHRRTGSNEPAGWRGALEHLRECGACRERALIEDPTLVFVAGEAVAVSEAEVEAMVADVGNLIRARETERAADSSGRRVWRYAAAAAAAAVMVFLPTFSARQVTGTADTAQVGPAPGADLSESPAPMIEALDRPEARIYQLGEEDLSIVMVVHESLDV